VKFFQDDLIMALVHEKYLKYSDSIQIESKEVKNQIERYVNDNLVLTMDKSKIPSLSMLNSELNDDAIWISFKASFSGKAGKKIDMTNTLLVNFFHDQTNLVILNYKGEQNGYRFNYYKRELELSLK